MATNNVINSPLPTTIANGGWAATTVTAGRDNFTLGLNQNVNFGKIRTVGAGSTPSTALMSADFNDGLIVRNAGAAIGSLGAGTFMWFDGSKSAVRGGIVSGTQWNAANVGTSSVAFGIDNIASGTATFAMGSGNTASSNYGTVFGLTNTNLGTNASCLGGTGHVQIGTNSGIVAGNTLTNNATAAFMGAGNGNTINTGCTNAFLGAGGDNAISASSTNAVLCGGGNNTVNGNYAGILAGTTNTAHGNNSVVCGGSTNLVNGFTNAFIGSGSGNTIGANTAAILCGTSNTASGANSTILNGTSNTTTGTHGMAAGFQAAADTNYSFSWNGDSSTSAVTSSTGHYLIKVPSTGPHEITCETGGGTCSSLVNNTSNSTNSTALIKVGTGGSSAGDPMMQWTTQATNFALGIDNSVTGDPLVCSAGLVLGTTNAFSISSSTQVISAAVGISFLTSGGTPATLAHFENGTLTRNWTGAIPSTAGNISYQRIGNQVTLQFPTVNATGNSATTITTTALPSTLFPVGVVNFYILIINAGVQSISTMQISAAGVITVYSTFAGGNFAGAGSTGFYTTGITYLTA